MFERQMSTKFFNNTPSNTLFEKLKGIATEMSGFTRFLAVVGYFRSSGYFKLRKELGDVSDIRILIGINIDNIFRKHNLAWEMFESPEKAKEVFSEEQEAQLRALEEDIIKKDILPVLTEQIEPALSQVQRELVLVVDYVPGEDLKVHLSRKRNLAETLSDAIEISPKRTRNCTATDITRSSSVGFTVKFADGHVVWNHKAKDTLIVSLQYMSLPRVNGFTDRTFAGFHLVDNRQRVTEDHHKWQERVDGWWIYVNMNNETKMEVLMQVARYLGVSLSIEVDGKKFVAQSR